MFDTNVLISMILFPSSSFTGMLEYITRYHTLVLSSFVLEELTAVIELKFPTRIKAIDDFLCGLSYELVYTPHRMKADMFNIRDTKDYPVLYSAIIEDIDIFITGDRDFEDIDIEKPEILTPAKFVEKYINQEYYT